MKKSEAFGRINAMSGVVKLKDGMLIVDLEKIVPEEKKPRSIKIS